MQAYNKRISTVE